MAELSPKVKESKGAKWCRALSPDLLRGETIWALVGAGRLKPLTTGVAITNVRVVGFFHGGQTTDKRVLLEVTADQIRGVDFPVRAGSTSMWIKTDRGEVNFGNLHKDEVDFARHYVEYLWRNAGSPEVAAAAEQRNQADADAWELRRAREAVKTFGAEMKDKWWDDIGRHTQPNELPWFIINGGSAGRLVAFEDRLLISKTGGLTSFMAGSLGGGRETIFPYADITNIEYNGGFANGVLEVLTPSYQGGANHDFWRSANKSRNQAADDPWTLSNCLPLGRHIYDEAQQTLIELQRKIMEYKRPQVVVHHAPPAAAANGATTVSLADELAKIADMHQRGLLDDDEFKAAKAAAISKLA